MVEVTQADERAARESWNAFADTFNKWENLSHSEQQTVAGHFAIHRTEAVAALEARVRELEGFVETLAGPTATSDTWLGAIEPLIARFTVASAFDMQAVHNGQGAEAIAKLMQAMASKLDWAQDAARKALHDPRKG